MLTGACGVAAPEARLVAADLLCRAKAAARLGRDSREILAAPFFEESFSHQPDETSAWLKAITTLVIRNSRPEDLHAGGPVNEGASSPSRPAASAPARTRSRPAAAPPSGRFCRWVGDLAVDYPP